MLLAVTAAALMIEALPRAKAMLGDRGYDADWFRAALAERGMQLQITVQEGQIWVGNGSHSVALEPVALQRPTARR